MLNRLLFCGLFSALACGGTPAPEPRAVSRTAPERTAPTVASAVPEAPAPAPPGPKAPSPFHVLGRLPDFARIDDAGSRGFVVSQLGLLYELVGDDALHHAALQRGFSDERMLTVWGIAGRWPDDAWLSTTLPRGRMGFTKLWRWDGKRWVSRRSADGNRYIELIRPWIGGRMLAIEQPATEFDATFVLLSGDKRVTVPVFTGKKSSQNFCSTDLMAKAFETLPTGEVFVAGLRCTEDSVDIGVERWAPGTATGTLETLPGTEGTQSDRDKSLELVGMAVRSATDVTVAGVRGVFDEATKERTESTYFAHFDGTRWREVSSKVDGVVALLDTTADGTLVVSTDRGQLYMGPSVEALTAVPLPEALFGAHLPLVTSVWSPAPGDIWAIAVMTNGQSSATNPSGSFYLLHTRPATKPLLSLDDFSWKEAELVLPGPPVEGCETPFVLLYTLGKKAPADYDYPSTRTALKGHPEFAVDGMEFIEFERLERRYFGARVPNFTLGRKLAALVKDKVPGSTPEVVCHNPPSKRTLTLDFTPSR